MNKYYLFILGCQMNISDAERMRTVLNSAGMTETDDEKSADLIIVVACSVRQSAIDRIHGKMVQWRKLKTSTGRGSALRRKNLNLKIALTGCVLPSDKKRLDKQFDIVFDISKMGQLPEILKISAKTIEKNYFKIRSTQTSKFSAQVPIMTGCNNFCSYCAVPYTRGREISRPQKEIISEIKRLVKKGYKDITLLGQNVNSYRPSFIDLIKKLDKIPGNYRVRFISNHPKDFSNDLIKFLKTAKHFAPYIHLPAQSGSDKILKTMRRPYKISDYIKLAQKIKKEMPNVCLTTDIIVGFPDETKTDFKKSCDLFRKIKYDMAFISQYSPRSSTMASRLKDDVSKAEKKQREKIINEVLKKTALENNKKLVKKTIKVLVEKRAQDGSALGRTSTLKSVKINNSKLPIGQFVKVKITKATAWNLKGNIT